MKPEQFGSVRKLNGGLNTYDDPQDIADNEFADGVNVVFDKGYPTPRAGSFLAFSKPTEETENPLGTFDLRASDGTNYIVSIYGNNFHFWCTTNSQWIKINNTYTPPSTNKTKRYSFVNWNAGIGSDRLYAGNGYDNFIKIPIAYSTMATTTTATDTTLVLTDGTKFPTSGYIAIKDVGGSEIYLQYSAKSVNTLTLVGTVGSIINSGAGVTMQVREVTTIPKGKVIKKNFGRLFTSGGFQTESTVYYSKTADPEDFTVGTTITAGGFEVITDGTAGVTLLESFGSFMVIGKQDSLHTLTFSVNQDLNSKLVNIEPLVQDMSLGPINAFVTIKKNDALYYPTDTEGILEMVPKSTGGDIATDKNILSQKIHNYATTLNFTECRSISFSQKLLWSCAQDISNDIVLVYDTLRQVWSKFTNWQVQDWSTYNKKLYFLSQSDGNIYECFHSSYTDRNNPYEASVSSKRFDMGEPSKPKTMDKIFIQGYITPTTELFFDVQINENGGLGTKTYMISGNGQYVTQVNSYALAMTMLGLPYMGGSTPEGEDTVGIFRIYLAIPFGSGFYNIQVRPYSNKEASYWGVTGFGFDPLQEVKAPAELVIGVIGDNLMV